MIILTSDHGDSLGEGGRWGHAYTIFPEVLRVPLIIHAPPALLADRVVDADRSAMLVDIAPTLYDLLGYAPAQKDPVVFGQSLLPSRGGTAAETEWRLVASSYGPVYGVLGRRGEWLYIQDAINYTDYYFDLIADPSGQRNVATAELRALNEARLREGITRIHRAWGRETF